MQPEHGHVAPRIRCMSFANSFWYPMAQFHILTVRPSRKGTGKVASSFPNFPIQEQWTGVCGFGEETGFHGCRVRFLTWLFHLLGYCFLPSSRGILSLSSVITRRLWLTGPGLVMAIFERWKSGPNVGCGWQISQQSQRFGFPSDWPVEPNLVRELSPFWANSLIQWTVPWTPKRWRLRPS